MDRDLARSRLLASIPTAREVGLPSLEMREWYGFFASASTPPDIVAAWNAEIGRVLGDPDLDSELAQLGLEAHAETPDQTHARLVRHLDEWRARMKDAGVRPLG